MLQLIDITFITGVLLIIMTIIIIVEVSYNIYEKYMVNNKKEFKENLRRKNK